MGEGTEQKSWFVYLVDGLGYVHKACLKAVTTWPGMAITYSVRRLKRRQ